MICRRTHRHRSAKSQRLQSCAVNRIPNRHQKNASNVQHIKQPGAWTPRKEALPITRSKGQTIRERPAVTQAHDLPPVPQAQARQAFVEKQAQLSQNPSIESIYPSEPAAPILPQPPVSEAPAITPERQPLTAGSGKPAPSVQPSAPAQAPPMEQPPPSVKSRSQALHRGKDPGAAFPFGQWIRNKSARQR